MKIKSIHTGSAGKTLGVSVAVVAFIIGSMASIIWLVFDTGRRVRRGGPYFDDIVTGPLAFLAFPLFFGAIAFVVGFVAAVIYNIAAGFTGGVELEVEGSDDAERKGKDFDW